MKAIETEYKGYLFRSRLEARWAVFFEAVGVSWEYEPQGFVLDDGTAYLPDFRIGSKTYVEVKGVEPTTKEIEKCRALGQENTVVLLWGPPNTANWHSRQYGLMYFWHGEEGSDMTFAQCRGRGKCKHLRLAWFDLDGTYHSCVPGIHLENDKCYAKRPDGDLQPVNEAANLAKRSRFEHGQRPPV